jgi:S-phase kinase-associated protein 1
MVKNSSEVAAKIITWCENSAPNAQWNPDAWLEMDQGLLFEVILMANALDLRAIVELCCGAVANMIKGKSVEEIRALLAMDNFDDGFTPEERAAVRAENAWAFE